MNSDCGYLRAVVNRCSFRFDRPPSRYLMTISMRLFQKGLQCVVDIRKTRGSAQTHALAFCARHLNSPFASYDGSFNLF